MPITVFSCYSGIFNEKPAFLIAKESRTTPLADQLREYKEESVEGKPNMPRGITRSAT